MSLAATDASEEPSPAFVAFAGSKRLAAGDLATVAAAVWRAHQEAATCPVLVFDRINGEVVDLDLRGEEAEVRARYAEPRAAPKRGRPRLGVVAREVTLLPRHWDWLAQQPGGASTTLRRLVELARKADASAIRARRDGLYRFMAAIAGDLPMFEEAARALFAGDRSRFEALIELWPADVRDELLR